MGRNKIYETEQQRHNAEKQRKRNWYYRNSTKVKKQRMETYWRNKKMLTSKQAELFAPNGVIVTII